MPVKLIQLFIDNIQTAMVCLRLIEKEKKSVFTSEDVIKVNVFQICFRNTLRSVCSTAKRFIRISSGQIVKSEQWERFPLLFPFPSLPFPFSLPLPSPCSPYSLALPFVPLHK